MSTLKLTLVLFRYYRQSGMAIVPAIRKTLYVVNRGF